MAKKTLTSGIIYLKNVRGSFLQLHEAKAFKPGQLARYEATFLLDPSREDHKAQILEIKKAAKVLIDLKGWEKGDYVTCFGLADENPKKKKYDGYAGMFYVVTANKDAPTVCGRAKETLIYGKKPYPYSGCELNTNITLWTQDNEFGKAIRGNLRIVQFVDDGKPFGNGPASADDEFEALGDAKKPVVELEDDIDL